MADDVLQSFLVAIGWKADTASLSAAKKSVSDYEQAVIKAEKAIEDARWAGAKTEEEIARLTRETNLRLAKEALQRAKDEEKQRQEADKKQEASLKAARARIGDFVKVAIGMGAAIEAAALGVHAGVVKMAEGFDTLNFTSQRTGVTVRNIQAIGYAASQMGSTVEAGVGSLESFARTLRQSPGSYSLLERLGIKTTDAKGVRRSADELFQEFGKALRSKPGYLQDQYLQDFGIDEKTGRALIQGLDKYTEEYNAKLRKTGLDPDKAAKDAAALQRTFGSLAASISIIGQKVASGLFSGENNAFQKFIDFLDQHGDEIASVITHIAQVVLELARALLELVTSPEAKKWFDTLMLAFGDFDKETGKFTANTEKMKAALGIFGAFVATTWLSKILGAFGAFGTGWKGLLAILGIGAGVTGTAAVGTAIGADLTTPNDAKPGASDQWDEDHAGAAPGGSLGALGRLAQRAWGATKHALGGGEADAAEGGVGIRARARRAKLGPDGIPYDAKSLTEGVGISQKQYDAYREGLTDIEGKSYTQVGGSGGRYSGRYQFGPAEIRQTAVELGENPPAREQFLADPAMQERFMERYTLDHHNYLMRHSQKYRDLSPEKRLEILGYAHNQGAGRGGALTYLETGRAGQDGFGTSGTAYFNPIRRRLSQISQQGADAAQKSAPKALTVQDVIPKELPTFNGGNLPSLASPSVPAPNMDNSKTMHVTIQQGDVNVHGINDNDAQRVGNTVGTVAGYRNSDLVRNLRSSLA